MAALSEYRLKRRVQFYETDAAGIVHFSWYFRYMEEAEHALWRAAGLSIHAHDIEISWPRVAASFEYYRALRFEDEFEVSLRIVAMTKKTIRYACDLTRDGAKIGSGGMTIACVRRRASEPATSIEIPPDIAARFTVSTMTDGAEALTGPEA